MDRVRPKISIIVPIYNVEAYLDHTLYSVVNQTLKDIEIICVNDCSTDRSQDILDRFLAEDDRIKLIRNTENIGVGLSRKKAIEYATANTSCSWMAMIILMYPPAKIILHNAETTRRYYSV